ncbi:hypothetical protein PIROE2DRAFT_14458, partial [Piromyces sp. E2]
IGHIILIYNAASVKSKIFYQLPEYTFKQYYYLRDVYPDCFPILNIPKSVYPDNIYTSSTIKDNTSTQLIDDLMNGVILSSQSIKNHVDNKKYQHALDIIADSKNKLSYIKKTKASFSEKVELVSLYLSCCKIVIQ